MSDPIVRYMGMQPPTCAYMAPCPPEELAPPVQPPVLPPHPSLPGPCDWRIVEAQVPNTDADLFELLSAVDAYVAADLKGKPLTEAGMRLLGVVAAVKDRRDRREK